MKIGFVGLGRMGKNMVLNLVGNGHNVVAYNRSPDPTKKLARVRGVVASYSIEEMINELSGRKIIWLMIKSGRSVDDVIGKLISKLNKGDIIIDGGNSYFEDSIKRAKMLKKKGVHFLDCGVSGGISGARYGACMMIGGERAIFKGVEKLFRDMCVKDGYGYMGKSGAGHFVKAMHNGIEYGMMGAIAEGVESLKKSKLNIDIKEAVKAYTHGSIIESRLMSWLYDSYNKKGYLESISGEVPKGETEGEMKKLERLFGMSVLRSARKMRVKTRKKKSYAGKLISAMRNQFGGHKIIKK